MSHWRFLNCRLMRLEFLNLLRFRSKTLPGPGRPDHPGAATAKGTLIRVMTRRRRGNDFFDSRNHHIFRRSLSAKVYQPQGVVTTIRGIRHRNKRSSPGLFLQDYRGAGIREAATTEAAWEYAGLGVHKRTYWRGRHTGAVVCCIFESCQSHISAVTTGRPRLLPRAGAVSLLVERVGQAAPAQKTAVRSPWRHWLATPAWAAGGSELHPCNSNLYTIVYYATWQGISGI